MVRRVVGERRIGFVAAAALALGAGVAIPPSASATFPGLNGQLAYESALPAGPTLFSLQPFTGPLDADVRLSHLRPPSRQPAWSADGRRIAFVTGRDGNREIYVMNADGTDQTRLTTNPASDSYPTWSPGPSGSARIAFTSTRDGDREIYVMDADGTDQTRLTFSAGVDQRPDWHPRGARIAFESARDGNYELYAMDTDGERQTRLTFHPGPDTEVSWKPDGKSLAFSSGQAGAADIFAFRTNRQGRRRHPRGRHPLIRDNRNNHNPAWSPDKRQMAFTSGRFTYVTTVGAKNVGPELAAFGANAAWGPLPRPDGVPEVGETVNIKPSGRVKVRVRGARTLRPVQHATEIPVGSLIDTQGGVARLETAKAGERSTRAIVVSGLAGVSQSGGQSPETDLRLPQLDCSPGGDRRSERHRIRSARTRRTVAGAGAGVRAAAARSVVHFDNKEHHGHRHNNPEHHNRPHDHFGPKQSPQQRMHLSPRTKRFDWTVRTSCVRTVIRVRTGVVEVRDLEADSLVVLQAGARYVTPALW
jgi:hypothetical protein